jgi:sugar transferase (PEP-CTERM system associated)
MAVLASIEFLLALAAVHLAATVRFMGNLPDETDIGALWVRASFFGAVVLIALTSMGLYQGRQRLTRVGVASRLLIALAFAAISLGLVYYAIPPLALGRGWWGLSVALLALFLCASRVVFARIVDQEMFRRRIVVYGAGKYAAALLQLRRRSDRRGFYLAAFLPAPTDGHMIEDFRVDRSPGNLFELARRHDADEIVMAMDDRRGGFPVKELLDCKRVGIDVIDIVAFLERESGKVKLDLMNPSWLVFSEGFTRRATRLIGGRVFDLAISAPLLLIALPIMLLAAVAILLEDGRPIFYRQTRVGVLGRHFELLKFRSMNKDAEKDGAARWAVRNDSRVTNVGALIRKLRIDELPQLVNVLKGDMRLVGPRPERPEFVTELATTIPYYHERHCVKPGLTGWAQLCYPYGSSERDALEKLQFDLYYVKYQSLRFDLFILLLTVEVVLWGKGAR